jgi:hypothetical protein
VKFDDADEDLQVRGFQFLIVGELFEGFDVFLLNSSLVFAVNRGYNLRTF